MLLKHKAGSLCQSKTPNKHRQKKKNLLWSPLDRSLAGKTAALSPSHIFDSSTGRHTEFEWILSWGDRCPGSSCSQGNFLRQHFLSKSVLEKTQRKKQKFQISHRFHSLSSRLEPWSQTFQKETDTRSRRREYFLCHHIGRSYLVLLQYQIEAVWVIFFVTETLNGLQLFFMLVHGNAHTRTHMRIHTERQRHTHTHKSTLFMTQRHVCRVACWSKAHGILLSHLPLERAR